MRLEFLVFTYDDDQSKPVQFTELRHSITAEIIVSDGIALMFAFRSSLRAVRKQLRIKFFKRRTQRER